MDSQHFVAVLIFTMIQFRSCSSCESKDGPSVWNYICVDEGRGNDSEDCLRNGCDNCLRPCRTLSYALSGASDLTRVDILGPVHLSNVVWTNTLQGLNISGRSGAILQCSGSSNAGLRFSNVTSLALSHFAIDRCGFELLSAWHTVSFEHCVDVTINDLNVSNSSGPALMFNDTGGPVVISRSTFLNNAPNRSDTRHLVGGAIRIFMLHVIGARYEIYYCKFKGNSVPMTGSFWEHIPWFVQGGAIYIGMFGYTANNSIVISSSEFTNNSARFGAGVYLGYANFTQKNSVEFVDCNFTRNRAYSMGGGLFTEYYNYKGPTPIDNKVTICRCIFLSNMAASGGGVSISATHGQVLSTKGSTVVFANCIFERNTAFFASAVDISPCYKDTASSGLLLSPLFSNCTFRLNVLLIEAYTAKTSHVSSGIFLVTGFTVYFEGNTQFSDNSATPLQLVSATANVSAGTSVSFVNNNATYGGAIQLIGFSEIIVYDDSSFLFLNNSAEIYGGAVYYYTYDQHDYITSDHCFLYYGGSRSIASRNLSFTFSGNKASSGEGNDIMAATFIPCFFACLESRDSRHNKWIFSFFTDCITRNLTYRMADQYALSTLASNFTATPSHLYITPGNETSIDVTIENELHVVINDVVYKVSLLTDEGSTCSLDSQYEYTFMKKTLIYGSYNQSGYIQLQTLGPTRIIQTLIPFTLLRCPPGFVNDNVSNNSQCVCCNDVREKGGYFGIDKCEGDGKEYRAYITQGYWAGYLNPSGGGEEGLSCDPQEEPCELYTSTPCPSGVCRYQMDGINSYQLPTNGSDLQEYICGRQYQGALCSTCQQNYSAYYHSYQFECKSNDICDYGLVLYMVSELLPLTILFVVLITFNVNLTSGWSNGFILFAQILQCLDVTFYGVLRTDPVVFNIIIAYKVLYGFVSMSFFNLETLSFCLWRGAQVLDIIAFRYVTTAYALALLVSLIFLMTHCSCPKACRRWSVRSPTRSIIHGLTAYLVLCFAQYTQTTFLILTPLRVFDGRGQPSPVMFTLYGGLHYFGHEHLKYVVPACVLLVTFVLLPPIVLLLYPVHYKFLALLGLAESPCIHRMNFVPVLKPFLDSLQGCFKDQFRFFSGLYFCYRLIPAVLQMACTSTFQYYVAMELLLLIILLLHAVCQPYVGRGHNVVDTCLFVDMAVINGITLYNYTVSEDSTVLSNNIALSWIQVVLAILPLVYMGCVVASNVGHKCCYLHQKYKMYRRTDGDEDNSRECAHNIQEDDTDAFYSAAD